MESAEAIAILRRHEGALRSRGARHAALFGSIARGEGHADSDLDVMIEIDDAAILSVYDYVGLCRFIGGLFPIAADVANRETLKARVRARVEHDAIPAF